MLPFAMTAFRDCVEMLPGYKPVRELMEQDESLLETLLGLHESIENLKARRQKDPVRSGRGRTNRDPDEDVDLDFDQDHDDAARPVMTPTMDDHFSDDVDDHCEDSRLWPAYDNDDSASVCSASLALSGNEQDDDNVDKPEFRGYYSRGFVRQRVSYPPIARNRVSNAGSPEKARLSTDEGDKTSTPKNPPFEDAGEDVLPFPDQLPTPTPMDKKRHEVFV
ncbi:unnamed protein product [Notodromas monacha]|uniref:Uncharacterized protein n=1 Tax=Notodromas monacha TaxID=399045 RepID=A0A7R9BXF1_9CRUS|nr:unnamed protein product [Notodromas monacha]CAG0922407.1 unnamed protein product [Notodromas monacha]